MTAITNIRQTRTGTDDDAPHSTQGNCLNAAFASILGLQHINDAPEYDDDANHWWDPFEAYLNERGLEARWLIVDPTTDDPENGFIDASRAPAGFCLASGPSPRGDWKHVVVAKDGIPVWDPAGTDEDVPYFSSYIIFLDVGQENSIPCVELPPNRQMPKDVRVEAYVEIDES